MAEVALGVLAEVGPLGQELAQEPVGVFVGPPLPAGMGVAEPDVDLEAAGQVWEGQVWEGQVWVAGHFQPAIIGHAFAEHLGEAFHLAREALQSGLCPVAVHFAQDDEAGLALDQGAHRGAAEGPFDPVAFPVARDQTGVHLFGPVNDLQGFRDDSTACQGSTPCPAARVLP